MCAKSVGVVCASNKQIFINAYIKYTTTQSRKTSRELHEYKNIKEGKGNKQRESHDKIHID